MDDCLFCNIAAQKIPAKVVYEDDLVIAFNDINPAAPVHVLVIPKKHISSLNEAEGNDTELLGHILLTVAKIAADLGIAADGYRLISNTGSNGGQVIYHLHFHVLGGKQLGSKLV